MEDKGLKRLSLRAVRAHSALSKKIEIMGEFTVMIRPWATEQLETLQPLLVRLFSALKQHDPNQDF